MRALSLTLVLLFGGAGIAAAQEIEDNSSRTITLGGSIGGGSGPTPVAVLDGSLAFAARPGLRVRLSVGTWTSVGACILQWPDSYACDADGWSGRLGVEVSPYRFGFLVPFVVLDGGLHSRSGPSSQWTHRPVVGAGVGARFDLSSSWSLRTQFRHSWIFDGAYQELMGEELRVTTFTLGFEYRLGR